MESERSEREAEHQKTLTLLQEECEAQRVKLDETCTARDHSVSERDTLKQELESTLETNGTLVKRLQVLIESHRADAEQWETSIAELTQSKESLTDELASVRMGLNTLHEENTELNKQVRFNCILSKFEIENSGPP